MRSFLFACCAAVALASLGSEPAHAAMIEVRYQSVAAAIQTLGGSPQLRSPVLIGSFTLRYRASGSDRVASSRCGPVVFVVTTQSKKSMCSMNVPAVGGWRSTS